MNFVFLTKTEADLLSICWENNLSKTPELIASALEAGFSELEVQESPVGVLDHDFKAGGLVFTVGALALALTSSWFSVWS